MSIRQRIEDSVILDSIGRKDGALLSACVAVSATSRLRYPKESTKSNWNLKEKMGDKEAFQLFLKDESESIYGPGLRLNLTSQCPSHEDPSSPPKNLTHQAIIYKYVRCELVHSAKIPPTIEFRKYGDASLRAAYLDEENKFVFSDNWLSRLIRVVIFASENESEFEEERRTCMVRVKQILPFSLNREDIEDYQKQLLGSSDEVEHDVKTIFTHYI